MISVLIKRILSDCRLTQKKLAEVMEVPLPRIKRLSGGEAKNLTREEGEKLIRKLNIRAEWLATGEGEMFRSEQEQEFHRRLDVIADTTKKSVLHGLSRDENARLQMLMLGLETGNTKWVLDALNVLSPDEQDLLDTYRNGTPEVRKALKAMTAAIAHDKKN